MRIFPLQVVPIFLNRQPPSPIVAGIRFFDVYYTTPPVVGWQVIGSDQCGCEPAVVGFQVVGEAVDSDIGVVGFQISSDSTKETAMGFYVSSGPCDENGGSR